MILGIDFGTNQLSAAWIGPDGSPALVPDKHDPETFATPVCICLEGDRAHVGRAADLLADDNATWPAARRMKAAWGTGSGVMTDSRGAAWLPETAITLLLRKIVDDAKLVLGRRPERAVITVPANFTAAERQAVWRAADWAGFSQVGLIEDGLAAARFLATGDTTPSGPILLLAAGVRQIEARVLTAAEGEIKTLGMAAGHGGEGELHEQLLATIAALVGVGADGPARTTFQRAAERQLPKLLKPAGREIEQVFFQRGRPFIVNLLPAHITRAAAPAMGKILAVADEALQKAGLGWRDLAMIWPVGCCALQPQLLVTLGERWGRAVTARQPLQAAAFGAASHGADLAAGKPWRGLPAAPGRPGAAFGLRIRDAAGQASFEELIAATAARPAKATRQFMTTRADQVRMVFELAFKDGAGVEPAGVLAFGPISRPRLNLAIDLQVTLDERGELTVEAVEAASGAKLPRTVVTKGMSSEIFVQQRGLLDNLRVS